MAKIDPSDVSSFYMNPSAYSQVKEEAKKTRGRGVRRSGEPGFSEIFENIRGKTADELGPLRNLPASEEAVSFLMDEVRSAGDILKDHPLPDKILRYKQAVRNFMHYVVENSYEIHSSTTILRIRKELKPNVTVQVVDKKLEDLAAMLLTGQMSQLKLAASLEEINGLLVDLLQ
ncbi:MAG: YaaR family protein [Treponema sp.]|jgi:uncharacterized protein YaaR (DUF327 family)|nr:YaaR family protein [Treponema sp.]